MAETEAQQSNLEVEHRQHKQNYETYQGVRDGSREIIVLGAGKDSVITLKQKFIGCGRVTPCKMIAHLCDTTSIQLTAIKKLAFKNEGYNTQWDTVRFEIERTGVV